MNISRKDVIWSYLARFFTAGVNVMLLPFILKFLSDEELGLWYVFASISQIVNLFDFGFNASLSRHMTYAWCGAQKLERTCVARKSSGEPDERLVSQIIASCRVVYFALSFAGLVMMMTAGTFYISQVVEGGMTKKVASAWAVYMAAVFLNLFYGYLTSLLQGIGAVSERNKMNVYAKIVQLSSAAVFLCCGMGLSGFVLSYFLSGLVLRGIGLRYFARRTSGLSGKRKHSMGEIRECLSVIWTTAWRDGVVMLAQYFITQANTLICAYYIDLTAASIYGAAVQIVSAVAGFASAYFSAYQPQYSSACLKRDKTVLRNITCVSLLVYKGIFAAGMVFIFAAGLPVLKIIRPGIQMDARLILAVGIFYYLYHQHSICNSMIASSNRILCVKAYVVTAAASFALSLFFVRSLHMGVWGLVMGQTAANLAYNNWKWPLFVMKENGLSYKEVYQTGVRCIQRELMGVWRK